MAANNNFFDYNRFAKLFKKHTAENYRTYLTSVIVLIGVMVLFFTFVTVISKGRIAQFSGMQYVIYLAFSLLAGSIFSSSVFSHFGEKKSGTMSLLLPCSGFEKFLTGWIYMIIIFPVIFTLCFYAVDIPAILSTKISLKDSSIYNVFDLEREQYLVFPAYLLLTAISFFGAIFFSTQHFIKTAALFFVAFFVVVLINSLFIGQLVPEVRTPIMIFDGLKLQIGEEYFDINNGEELLWLSGTMFFLTPIFWLAAYFKLKEKQI